MKEIQNLFDFIENTKFLKEPHAVQIVPYGEALIHEYYWQAMASLSQIETQDYTGCQTNLSFPIEKMLNIYDRYRGKREKLRLWCTFHPSMTTVDDFVEQCNKLKAADISFCAGMVGDPEEIPALLELRRKLPDSIYLWINKMDGLKNRYTPEEIEIFQNTDPYFFLQLKHRKADLTKCRHSVFHEADGREFFCNLHASSKRTACDGCGRKECNCYLAYCNRKDIDELLFFEPYPAFRIPRYPKAFFMDIDGTIVPDGEKEVSSLMANRLIELSKKCRLFLATQLPFNEAMRKCKKIWSCLSGGIFSGGGYIYIKRTNDDTWEMINSLKVIFSKDEQKYLEKKYHFHTRIYRKDKIIYRYTLISNRKNGWKSEELTSLQNELELLIKYKKIPCTLHPDKRCFGITGENADKKNGVLTICQKEGISLDDGVAAGDSEDDIPMLKLFPVNLKLGENK